MSVTTAAGAKVSQAPREAVSPVQLKPRYENFVGGHWVPPVHGEYMKDLSPANARQFTEGEPESFSLPAGDDRHFVTRSRVSSPAGLAALRESP